MKNIIKVVNYSLYMIFMQLRGIKYSIIKCIKGTEKASAYVQKILFLWSKFTINIIGIDIELHGQENIPDEPCIYVSNHSSILDIPVLLNTSNKKIGFIAKKEILKFPIIGYWLKRSGSISLDRNNPRDAIRCINECKNNLNSGYSIAIFPEGTRNKNGQVSEFKKGSIKFATKSKVPIVPVSIEHASRSFEDNKKFLPCKINVFYDKPIDTCNLTKDDEKKLPDAVRKIIVKNLSLE